MKRAGVLFILFLALGGFAFAPAAYAATTAGTGNVWKAFPTASDVVGVLEDCGKTGTSAKECYVPNSAILNINAGTIALGGVVTKNPNSPYNYSHSLLALLGGVVSSTYTNPPASVAYWIDDVGHDLGFAPRPAYAQGIGFSGFSALLPLWKAFRNIAYFLLAVIMIVIGFMVMLRKKIDPKTVVTVQNALPRIVLTLILITFSYAIVGLLIDVMYLIMYLAVSMFTSTGLLSEPGSVASFVAGTKTTSAFYTQGNLFANIGQATSTLNVFKLFGISGVSPVAASVGGMIAGTILLAISGISGIPQLALAGGAFLFAIPVLQFLLAVAMLFLFIRLLIFFIGAYIQVVVAMLFGPIQILFEAVPGTNSFASWLQNLIANLSVFPVGVIFFMLSAVFSKFADQNSALWAPGLTSLTANTTGISALISLGILFAIPSIGGSIKEALKAKPFVSAGPEGIAGAFGQPAGVAMQLYQMYVSHKSMEAFSSLAGQKKEAPKK